MNQMKLTGALFIACGVLAAQNPQNLDENALRMAAGAASYLSCERHRADCEGNQLSTPQWSYQDRFSRYGASFKRPRRSQGREQTGLYRNRG